MLLSVNNLTVQYQNSNKPCLNNINIQLNNGEIKAIVGQSGAGKTTLASFIAGLYPNNNCKLIDGSILYNGLPLANDDIQRILNVCMFFQNSSYQFCMRTLREEIRFVLSNLLFDEHQIDIRINELIHELPIINILDRDFASLSLGEKQLAVLTSLIVIKSRILILDEPFSHMDDALADKVIVYLHKLCRKDNIAILCIDHIIERWLDVCINIYLLDKNGNIKLNNLNKQNYLIYENIMRDNGIYMPYKHPKRTYHEKNKENILCFKEMSLINRYNDDVLFYNANINIPKNSIVAIYGKSGVGKTTLLNALSNNDYYEGLIELDGLPLDKYKRKALMHKIRFVMQESDDVFVKDNIKEEMLDILVKLNKEIDYKTLNELADEELKDLDLLDYASSSPYILSLGQRRRFIIRLALLMTSDILLIDEPTYGQDYISIKKIMDDILRMKKNHATIIFTTHNLDIAREYADMLLCIKDKALMEVR